MGGFLWAVRSGLVGPPFAPGAAARDYYFMPYILHLPWKEEVLVDAPKRSVYQLSLWLSCHIPPRCRWSVPGPQYARTSPNQISRKFGKFGVTSCERVCAWVLFQDPYDPIRLLLPGSLQKRLRARDAV